MSQITEWLKLFRIGNSLAAGLAGVMGYIVSGGSNLFILMLVYLVVVLVTMGGNAINDYFDRDIDAINKPWRPIPKGAISPRQAVFAAILSMSIGLVISYVLNLFCFIVALFATVLLILYSYRIKRTGIPGNIVIALLTALSIVFGGIAAENIFQTFVPATYAFLLNLGREFMKGLEDIEGDKAFGVKTLAVVKGPFKAYLVSSILLILVITISPLPYILFKYNILYLVLVMAIVNPSIVAAIAVAHKLKPRYAWKATRILKISMFVGIIAFLLGRLNMEKLIYNLYLIS